MSRLLKSAAACLIFSSMAFAQNTADESAKKKDAPKMLSVGDKAPAINDIDWVKGKGIEAFAPGESYVVECWATWCGPCIKAFPHLSKLQKQYKDQIQILGIAIWERGDDIKSKIVEFVKDQGDKMDYTVGMEMNDSIAKNWMAPAGQNGIPCAYLVDKTGRIAWIGHPGSIDPVLEKYVAGEWDTDSYAAEFKKQQEMEREMQAMMPLLMEASTTGNLDKALPAIDKMIVKHPDMQQLKMMKFQLMLSSDQWAPKAYEVGEQILKANWDDSQVLNGISWEVLTGQMVKNRNLEFAMKAVNRANELTKGEDPSILDTMARACFDMGKTDKAIEIQEKAVSLADDGPMKDELKMTLERYVNADPAD